MPKQFRQQLVLQSHARLCSPVIGQSFKPPVGFQHSNSPPTCSADTYFFQSIEPFTRLTVATRHQRGGAGFPPGTPCHAGEATFQRQKSFSTYRESRYMLPLRAGLRSMFRSNSLGFLRQLENFLSNQQPTSYLTTKRFYTIRNSRKFSGHIRDNPERPLNSNQ